jgi:hypothetical protein
MKCVVLDAYSQQQGRQIDYETDNSLKIVWAFRTKSQAQVGRRK